VAPAASDTGAAGERDTRHVDGHGAVVRAAVAQFALGICAPALDSAGERGTGMKTSSGDRGDARAQALDVTGVAL
jgi:hypothetical protein